MQSETRLKQVLLVFHSTQPGEKENAARTEFILLDKCVEAFIHVMQLYC